MVRDLLVHGCFEKQMLRESSDSCVDFSNGVESSKSRYTENVSESSSDSDRFRPLKKLGQSLDVRKAISSKIFSNGVSKQQWRIEGKSKQLYMLFNHILCIQC